MEFSLSSTLFVFDKENKASGDPIAALESVAAAGFSETELVAEGEEWQSPGPHDSRRFRKALERLGILPHTIHTPLSGMNLTSTDEAVRKESIARTADAMRFGGEVGARVAVVHPTGRPGQGEPSYEWSNLGAAMDIAHRSVAELVRVAEQTGVRIALENLPNTGLACRPLVSMEGLRAFVSCFPGDQVGLCLDTGHAVIVGLDPAHQAAVASERLIALHIQDVDGKADCHWIPGKGMIDWASLGKTLSDIRFAGAWTLEVLTCKAEGRPGEIASECAALCERWKAGGMS